LRAELIRGARGSARRAVGAAVVWLGLTAAASAAPIEVKVVVVTMFEIGADSGDTAGEFQLWKQRQNLDKRFPFAHYHDLFFNEKTGVLGLLTGEGTANSASAVMELGMDPRFDLTHAYWVVAGIAGVDPADASIGSAAWAEYVVDGDLAHEIDAREMPSDWTTGRFPLDSKRPDDPDAHAAPGQVFHLNPALVNWAYALTRNIDLGDSESLKKSRNRYAGYPNALKPPFVLKGDNLAAMTFWHGKLLNDWANSWVSYWTKGKGNFVTSAMEDSGTLVSLNYLSRTGKVDKERALVLRTASNYTMQPPGLTAAQNMAKENEGYSGLSTSVESAYKVGSTVVNEILKGWSTYRDHPPATAGVSPPTAAGP
jgi:purine nucleoside permease